MIITLLTELVISTKYNYAGVSIIGIRLISSCSGIAPSYNGDSEAEKVCTMISQVLLVVMKCKV